MIFSFHGKRFKWEEISSNKSVLGNFAFKSKVKCTEESNSSFELPKMWLYTVVVRRVANCTCTFECIDSAVILQPSSGPKICNSAE